METTVWGLGFRALEVQGFGETLDLRLLTGS